MISFSFYRVLGFYIFFEVSLLPLIFMILGWGYQVERLQASFYLFIYTIFGSMPFLLVIFFLDSAFLDTT
jgi:NADH-ubiquinone oxidoreductase chain 4